MILIIGGFCQGKTEYLKTLPEYRRLEEEGGAPACADGENGSLEEVFTCPVILRFHNYVKLLSDETRIREMIDRIMTENPNAIITMDEVGYGIVPINPEDRIYRELVGVAGQRLAKEASQVHRVVCGIGSRIK